MQYTGSSQAEAKCPEKIAIHVRNLWKGYTATPILKGLDLALPEGKTLIILGRSGVGKSVLLRQLLGLEKPDQGTIDVNGIRITDLKQKELLPLMNQFGMLFQSSALFDSMTIYENVAFYLNQHGDPATKTKLPISEIKDRVAESLTKVGLADYETKMPSELSGGQKRRAALARLIIYRPKILLYDEPTTGLDPITSTQINELIIQTQHELQATSIVVTHDIHSALEVGDLFALHHEGKLQFFDEKDKFVQNENPLIRNFFLNAGIQQKFSKLLGN
jgi:phospholipid/cholesterol/gamma-HCH transport system ATP-binding protein